MPGCSAGRSPSGSASTLSIWDHAQSGTATRKTSHSRSATLTRPERNRRRGRAGGGVGVGRGVVGGRPPEPAGGRPAAAGPARLGPAPARRPAHRREHAGRLGVAARASRPGRSTRPPAPGAVEPVVVGLVGTTLGTVCHARTLPCAHDVSARARRGEPVAALPVSHARTSLSLLADQNHVNLLGNVHGGEIMQLVDSTAGAVAQRHSGGRRSPRRWTRWRSCSPVHVGDIVRTMAQVNWAGRTSMEIGVRVESERWNEARASPPRRVGVPRLRRDRRRRTPREVPPLVTETPDEHRREREAEIRRAHRLSRRAEIERGRSDPSHEGG